MRQIHAAIEHWQRGDFECATTLAGAAEGMIPDPGTATFRDKVKAMADALPKKDGNAHKPNDFANWLKHAEAGRKKYDKATMLQIDVIAIIWRAISKYQEHYEPTPQMESFANTAARKLKFGD